jgi:hypothetical protein
MLLFISIRWLKDECRNDKEFHFHELQANNNGRPQFNKLTFLGSNVLQANTKVRLPLNGAAKIQKAQTGVKSQIEANEDKQEVQPEELTAVLITAFIPDIDYLPPAR